jgi:uncharacterized damage-inducible protein DinB
MPSTSITVARPEADEFNPYYSRYISLVPDANILATLRTQVSDTQRLLQGVSEDNGNFKYAPGKWSIKEVLGHLSDAERVFAYRALRIARHDPTPMEGFEQDDYVRCGGFAARELAEVVEEFVTVRQSSLHLLTPLEEAAWTRRGTANGSAVSVRAIAFIMAGHELHHRRLLKENYGL